MTSPQQRLNESLAKAGSVFRMVGYDATSLLMENTETDEQFLVLLDVLTQAPSVLKELDQQLEAWRRTAP